MGGDPSQSCPQTLSLFASISTNLQMPKANKTNAIMRTITTILLLLTAACPAQDVLPDAAGRLKDSYNRAIRAANKPIMEQYIAELRRLKTEATKAGRLSDAVAIDKEISSFAEAEKKSLVEAYAGTWVSAKHQFTLKEDGSAQSSYGPSGQWSMNDKSLLIKWSNGFSHEYRISQDKDKLDGNELNPNGSKGERLRYTRKP